MLVCHCKVVTKQLATAKKLTESSKFDLKHLCLRATGYQNLAVIYHL